jgi:hypothetical protein
MKTKFIFLVVLSTLIAGIFLLPGTLAKADITSPLAAPSFSTGERIQAGGSDLQVPRDGGGTNLYTVPCVVDWNEDGRKDLLVGCFYNGFIYLYLNSGTNNAPVFTTGSKLKADGVDIAVNYG